MTIAELKDRVESRYQSTLKKVLLGENPFPVEIGYKRPKRSGDPAEILRLKSLLRSQSKAENGFGPTVHFEKTRTRKFGAGTVPGGISFDSLDDLTRYIGKKFEADRILAHAAIITSAFPNARSWNATRLSRLSDGNTATWEGIVKATRYFTRNPKPWVYPREVPLGLHTKFLEENYSSVVDLLVAVAPKALNADYTNWQDRLGLRSSSEMVEGRFLDKTLVPHLPQHMLAPVHEWNRCAFYSPTWVLITENRTTLLTLPMLKGCLALLGKGYAVSRLAQIEKLATSKVYYWGDIDQHGLEILASLRSHLSNTESVLMDERTLDQCRQNVGKEQVKGTLPEEFILANLRSEEQELWRKCSNGHIRLEQETIPNEVAHPILDHLAASLTEAH